MLAIEERGSGDPAIFFLHFLGGSGQNWRHVGRTLEADFTCIYLDLPGFGASRQISGFTVAEMADAVAAVIAHYARPRWMIAAHSMGAKVASVVARRAEDGASGLTGLAAMVLAAGSPPAPEPMEDSRRETMRKWFAGDEASTRKQAEQFVDANRGLALAPSVKEDVVADVLRMHRAAWLAWLDGGSREDWSSRIGVLQTPVLILAGEIDKDLGPSEQRSLMLPHFARGRLEVLPGAKHLLPLERPSELAAMLREQWEAASRPAPLQPQVDPAYLALIASDRVSPATRAALMSRLEPHEPYQPRALTVEQVAILQAVVDRVIPQAAEGRIDIVGRLDQQLATGQGDGWRYAALPGDKDAYCTGLLTLDRQARSAFDQPFVALEAEQQDRLLDQTAHPGLTHRLVEAVTGGDKTLFDAKQMTLWFEDLRADAVKAYVAHPATLASIGYSGIGDGADAATAQGFVQVGLGAREPWEPVAKEVGQP